uniref:Uncharacterized protein n=1 Tax=Ditylenchus dipsaci TaxID=166011 RepID=A0A915DE41_9BILA
MDHSALFVAAGDSAANSHFFTGTGLIVGRMSGTSVAELVKQYNSKKTNPLSELVSELNDNFEEIKNKVREINRDDAKYLLKDEIDKIALNAMCLELNKMKLEKQQIKMNEDLSPENHEFEILIDEKVYPAAITENGQIRMGKRPEDVFSTYGLVEEKGNGSEYEAKVVEDDFSEHVTILFQKAATSTSTNGAAEQSVNNSSYVDEFARFTMLALAAAAYNDQPEICLNNTFANVSVSFLA